MVSVRVRVRPTSTLTLNQLLAEFGFPPMRWPTGTRDGRSCPTRYRHWRTLKGRLMEAKNVTSSVPEGA